MLRESPRPPYPISWEEQDAIFRRLPDHTARMALFAVNTGLRDANLCGLQWSWEVPIPELARSVFSRDCARMRCAAKRRKAIRR
jgi:integrase